MRFLPAVAAVTSALAFFPIAANADEVSLGYVSFDQLILGSPGSPGVNGFTIGNLTGDPANGGNDLPPTWPVLTTVVFQDSSLELVSADCTQNCAQTYDLGNIGPGFFQAPSLQFPDTAAFASATFSAVVDSTSFDLDGGGTFVTTTNQISAALLPSSGNSLTAGTDSVLISISNEPPIPTPEPSAS